MRSFLRSGRPALIFQLVALNLGGLFLAAEACQFLIKAFASISQGGRVGHQLCNLLINQS